MCCANFGNVTFLDLWRSNGWQCQQMACAMDYSINTYQLCKICCDPKCPESGLNPGWGLYGVVLFNVLVHQGQIRSCGHKRLAGKVTSLYGLYDDML